MHGLQWVEGSDGGFNVIVFSFQMSRGSQPGRQRVVRDSTFYTNARGQRALIRTMVCFDHVWLICCQELPVYATPGIF